MPIKTSNLNDYKSFKSAPASDTAQPLNKPRRKTLKQARYIRTIYQANLGIKIQTSSNKP